MVAREFTYLSADGEHAVHAVEWLPQDSPKAVLQIIHGMCEYKERYESFAEYLCGQGFTVVMHDQLGHGDTARSKEEFGLFTKKPRDPGPKDVLLADIHSLRVMMQQKYPDIPYFILGHSMGSYELRTYISRYENGRMAAEKPPFEPLTGAVIMGTGYVPPLTTMGGLTLLRLIAARKGWAYRSRFIRKIATGGGPYKRYDTYGKDPERSWLCKDMEIVKAYYANPKSHFIFTLNGYEGLLGFVLESCQKKNIRKIPDALHLLLVSGSEDPVGDMGKGVRTLYTLLRKAGHSHVSLRLFAGDRHEILNEEDRAEVYQFILHWMQARMADRF